MTLNVIMQGRKPICSNYSERGHVEADCKKKLKPNQKEITETE